MAHPVVVEGLEDADEVGPVAGVAVAVDPVVAVRPQDVDVVVARIEQVPVPEAVGVGEEDGGPGHVGHAVRGEPIVDVTEGRDELRGRPRGIGLGGLVVEHQDHRRPEGLHVVGAGIDGRIPLPSGDIGPTHEPTVPKDGIPAEQDDVALIPRVVVVRARPLVVPLGVHPLEGDLASDQVLEVREALGAVEAAVDKLAGVHTEQRSGPWKDAIGVRRRVDRPLTRSIQSCRGWLCTRHGKASARNEHNRNDDSCQSRDPVVDCCNRCVHRYHQLTEASNPMPEAPLLRLLAAAPIERYPDDGLVAWRFRATGRAGAEYLPPPSKRAGDPCSPGLEPLVKPLIS